MSRVQFESEEPVAVGWWRRPLSSPPAQDGAHAAAQADAVADRVESVVQQAFPDLWAELTDAGRAHLVGTLLTAKHPGERGRVVAGWYRTMVLLSDPAFHQGRRDLDDGQVVRYVQREAQL